jgi:hypothetical protein
MRAGIIGAIGFAVIQAATLAADLSSPGQASNSGCTISTYFVAGLLLPAMLVLWVVSVFVLAVAFLRIRSDRAGHLD